MATYIYINSNNRPNQTELCTNFTFGYDITQTWPINPKSIVGESDGWGQTVAEIVSLIVNIKTTEPIPVILVNVEDLTATDTSKVNTLNANDAKFRFVATFDKELCSEWAIYKCDMKNVLNIATQHDFRISLYNMDGINILMGVESILLTLVLTPYTRHSYFDKIKY